MFVFKYVVLPVLLWSLWSWHKVNHILITYWSLTASRSRSSELQRLILYIIDNDYCNKTTAQLLFLDKKTPTPVAEGVRTCMYMRAWFCSCLCVCFVCVRARACVYLRNVYLYTCLSMYMDTIWYCVCSVYVMNRFMLFFIFSL